MRHSTRSHGLDQSVAAPEDEEARADDHVDHHAPRHVPLRDRDERQPGTVMVCKVPAGMCEVGDRQEQRPEQQAQEGRYREGDL